MDSDSSDSTIVHARHKRQKSNDLISNLPDSIIGHILSFLPTKFAVRTSVLSKRWTYLRTFITKLHFRDREPFCRNRISKTPFLNFVYRVLIHLNTSSIQTFSLCILENYDPYHVNQWISAILNRGVKKLLIESKKTLNFSSHNNFFKCESLEELELKMNGCTVRVPKFVCLSILTTLKLSGVTFTCDPSNDSEKLRLNLPVLIKYETKNCTWLSAQGVTIVAPLLEVVSIKHKATDDESNTSIKFRVSRLKKFTYIGYMLPNTILLDLSSARTIASAYINPLKFKQENKEETAYLACKLLKQFSNKVQCLEFQRSQVLELVPHFLQGLPFGMLSRLELETVTGDILFDLLQNTPFLETTLIFKILLQFGEESSITVPDCFVSSLKVVHFGIFNGGEHELRFAKFVMGNALVLERAIFSPDWKFDMPNFEKVKEKLFSFKKSARFAYMEFSQFHPVSYASRLDE